ASTERSSACGTIIMMASPAVMRPPTVCTVDCSTMPSCGARMSMRRSWSSAVTLRSTNSPILSLVSRRSFGDLADHVLVDLDDLQFGLGDLALGLGSCGGVL